MGRKSLQEQTMKNSFLFAAVMLQGDNCRDVLSCVLGIEIERVEVSAEKSIVYHPEYHGVRLDVFAKGADGAHFNVEMQVVQQRLQHRSRYYHAQMDMEMLTSGTRYEDLPDTYVIFICDYDPIGLSKYRYTVKSVLEEEIEYSYIDGQHTIFLNTKGTNESEVPKQLVNFLHFMGASLQESRKEYDDELVRKLQQTVENIKRDREMEGRYMLLEELMDEEFNKGRAEGEARGRAEGEARGRAEGEARGRVEGKADSIIKLLAKYGDIPEEVQSKIVTITDINKLDELFDALLNVNSEEEAKEFIRNL